MKHITFSLLLSCSFCFGALNAGPPVKQVTVGADSTVYGIAHENGIRTQALIQANNLKPPYALKKGQVLRIPGPNEHVVRNGENLHSIAEDYGVKPEVLAQENDIQSPYYVKDGDTLLIPPADTVSMAEALQPPSQEISTSSLEPLPLVKSEPAPAKSNISAASPPPAPVGIPNELAEELAREKGENSHTAKAVAVGAGAAAVGAGAATIASSSKQDIMGNLSGGKTVKPNTSTSTPTPISSSQEDEEPEEVKPKIKKVKSEDTPKNKEEKLPEKSEVKNSKKEERVKEALFIWPVKGKIISNYSGGGKNDGINIQVPEGTSVKAAAQGEVMYSGNELKGFGNLILLKHKDGWMTAYAHNSELLVKKGTKVNQGDIIAKSGQTGDVKSPQLHFEVRKGKQPVDPLPKLES
jgi:murein DD-endopeptidase MepM/ murein hydrolase activator NlpD